MRECTSIISPNVCHARRSAADRLTTTLYEVFLSNGAECVKIFLYSKKIWTEEGAKRATKRCIVGLYDVPSVNLRKGAPSAGGPARTWNSQATDER